MIAHRNHRRAGLALPCCLIALALGCADARALVPGDQPGTAPAFSATVSAVQRWQLPYSWRPGCPVHWRDLRLIQLTHWGFDGRSHQGRLVVHRIWAWPIVRTMKTLFQARFPVRSMRLVDYYRADDQRSMAADNTSAFNCRFVAGTTRWSEHAYGRAIDLNPVENPYVAPGRVSPAAGAPYADRSVRRPGMIMSLGVVVRSFAAIGWGWGGRWYPARDYQHLSATGR